MRKIIHVDNSEFFRKLMKSFLEKEGFVAEGFESAQDAIMVICGGAIDMVIMGLTFTDIAGEEFFKKIRQSYEGPVIVVSSSVDWENEKKLLALGAKAALNKSGPWQEGLKPHLAALKG